MERNYDYVTVTLYVYRKMLCNYYIRIVVIFLLSKILITTAFSGRCSDGPVGLAGSVPDFIGVV